MNTGRFPFLPPLAALAVWLGAPAAISAQSILRTAGDYTLLGGTAITSTGVVGTNIITGNVGLSPGATSGITGFPPAVLSGGGAIISTGAATGQARLDLISASVGLAGMPSNANMSNVDLGGLTLTPGVYTFNGAASLNGALTLDAGGQNNVAWIFQIGTGLTTAVNSSITFTNLGSNNGSDLGLFWNAGSAVVTGANNQLFGNYLAGTSITFGSLTTNGGRALALAGVSLDNNRINSFGGPAGGDLTGGLIYGPNGNVILSTLPTVPGAIVGGGGSGGGGGGGNNPIPVPAPVQGTLPSSGSVLVSSPGAYTPGGSGLVLIPGTAMVTTSATVDGKIANSTTPTSVTVTAATVTLTGANTYTGGTSINAGTLIATTATLPSSQAVTMFNGSTIVFNQTTDGTFTGAITGDGAIQKHGAGALTFTTTTTAPVDIQAGALLFSRGLGSTTVASGAFLRGSGTITGNLINRGTVSPGTSPGAITVTGNYTQSSSGSLVVEIASATSFDQLTITGSAALDGNVQIDLLGGYNPIGNSFSFLTATGGVTGRFSSTTGSATLIGSAATAVNLTYAPTAVTVAFVQRPFAGFAVTPNQVAIGNAAQTQASLTTTLNTLPLASQFPTALNALSPQGYSIWSDVAFARTTALAVRLGRDDHVIEGEDNYYFDASQRRGRARGDLDVGSTTFTTTAGLLGGDRALNAETSLGGFFEHAKTKSGLGSAGSRTTIKSNTLGLRTAWGQGALFADGVAGYSFDKYTSTRAITFQGSAATTTSSTEGGQWFAGLSGGQHVNLGALTLSPFIGVLASGWKADGFTESGAGAFNVTVADQSARSLRSELGFAASLDVNLGAVLLKPRVRAAWLHEFSNDARRIDASFGTSAFTVSSRDPQRDSALINAGLDVVLGPRTTLYADSSLQTGGVIRINSEWRVGLAIRF